MDQHKDHSPEDDGKHMMKQVYDGLGIPPGTSMWEFPRKPLGKGAGKGGTKGGKPSGKSSAKGHSRGVSRAKKSGRGGWSGWG